MILTDALYKYIIEGTPQCIVDRYAGLKRAAEGDFGVLDEDVVVIDTETTGVSFKHDQLTQIAAARMRHGEITEWFVTFVNPGKPIPEDIAHLTNIHDEDVADAPNPVMAVRQLVEFVGESNLVAHNANFDRHFCTKIAAGVPLKSNIWIDSLDLARIALPRLKSHRLLDLVRAFDAPVSTHRADADVEALCAIYRILLAAVEAMPADLVKEIAAMADEDVWPTSYVFKQMADPSSPRFSLRRMRQNNLFEIGAAPRADAADLAADPSRGLKFASTEEIRQAFSPDGVVGKMYDHFEARDEQVAMAQSVNEAFSSSENLVIEAGTGVGKSMAYLVPAVVAAKRNGISVGIATKTNALLDQLVNHELPALADEVGGLDYCSLKGFAHYPCLRKVDRILQEGPGIKRTQDGEVSRAPALAGLLSFAEQTDYDDIDGLKIDYRALPRYEITTTSHDCLRRKCPFFGTKCFVHASRLRAERADIVVTNQTLLFCDALAEGGLLPPIRYWVVDEAHGAEAEARNAFSTTIDAGEIDRLLRKVDVADASRNIFMRTERLLTGNVEATEEQVRELLTPEEQSAAGEGLSCGDTLVFALCGKAMRAGKVYSEAARAFGEHIHDLLAFDNSRGPKNYDIVDVWISDEVRESRQFESLVGLAHEMCDAAEKLIGASRGLICLMEDVKQAAALQRELASATLGLKDQLSACETILFHDTDAYAYSAHLIRRPSGRYKGSESLTAQMMSVGPTMNETLYARTHSIVFTSATMAIADTFDSFVRSLGLGESEYSSVRTCKLDSSYDFDANMTIYVAQDMPEPNDKRYLEALSEFLVGIHRAQGGSTLSLFTNRREMEKCYDVVGPALKTDDLRVVCQKWGVSVKGLRDDFIADEHLSLFALKSFWEGFDAPGSTLKTVVIPKLPFSRPTDPLSLARQQVDPQAWSHYALPTAVLETRQAAGRLIRKSTDTGNLVLADKRLVSKGYGKAFLKSMPSSNIQVLPMGEIISRLTLPR